MNDWGSGFESKSWSVRQKEAEKTENVLFSASSCTHRGSEKVVRAKKKVKPRNYGGRTGRGRAKQQLKIMRGDGTKANGLGEEAQEGGKETGGQGQKSFGWSENMRKLKQCYKSLSPLENLEFSSVALNFWTFLLRDPGTERVQKCTANETLNNKVSRIKVNNDTDGFEANWTLIRSMSNCHFVALVVGEIDFGVHYSK